MKKVYYCILGICLGVVVFFGVWSIFDENPTISKVENRKLAAKPEFSWSTLLDGSYIRQVETYYSDTFPFREQLLVLNKKLNNFYYFSGDDNVLIMDYENDADKGGEALGDVQDALGDAEVPTKPKDDTSTGTNPNGETTTPPVAPIPEPTKPEQTLPPDINVPDEEQAVSIGTIIVVEDNAMDVPTANYDAIQSYAQTMNQMAISMGEDVQTISLLTPNSAEFYTPESFHTGSHSQKDMIDHGYSQMDESVITVDAYKALQSHADEYIYFRTDHHWTALGAYYAYVEFCTTMGFEPVALESFESGSYETFLGSMYNFTAGYPQSDLLKNNPDKLTYYLPVVETHAKYYLNSSLTDGIPISVVYTKLQESVTNKYLCFIGGDTPVCVIETAVDNDQTALVIKESYGNAFVPFLTSHYSKIIVVDPREFNREGLPSLYLPDFAKEHGVDDMIVINYPFMLNNTSYIEWLNRLIRKP